MTESMNDNNPTIDKLSVFESEDQTLETDIDGDEDFFICRKCNKVFGNLPEYLEHKVKDENYRIAQMRSKVDRRMVLPQLVQKRKKTKRTKGDENKEESIASGCENKVGGDDSQLPAEKQLREDGKAEMEGDGMKQQELTKEDGSGKKGRKRKLAPEVSHLSPNTTQGNAYVCSVCKKQFRREATLRWHMKYDHRKKDDSDGSESSDNELRAEAMAEADEDFKIDEEREGKDDHIIEGDEEEKINREIHIIIEQSQSTRSNEVEKSSSTDALSTSGKLLKQRISKQSKTENSKEGDMERPYVCDTCGRGFKELTVLKAHSVVHSEERQFVCTADGCPYGFKTKGGLVRHMRRHTGERPYACEKCGRAFSESGALTRHLKARRNCSQTPDSAYPRYMKHWTYHPNIPAVIDPTKRDPQQGRSLLRGTVTTIEMDQTEGDHDIGEVHFLITEGEDSEIITAEIISPRMDDAEVAASSMASAEFIVPPLVASSSSGQEIKIEKEEPQYEEWTSDTGNPHESSEVMTVAKTEVVGDVVTQGDNELIVSEQHIPESTEQPTDGLAGDHNTQLQSSLRQERQGISDDADLIELRNTADVEVLKLTQCHVCKKDFEAVEGLEIHLKSHLADQPSRCGICHFLSQGREDLRQHILSMHYESLNNITASVLAMEEVDNNKNESLQDRKIVLRDALVAVKQLYSLKKDKLIPQTQKPSPSTTGSLQCMVCNRYFRGSSYLRQHMRTHTGDRPHHCHLCSRSFTSRDILKKHMFVHKEQRDFKCGECGKLFKRLAHVQQHLRIHSQERSYRCTVCDKLFKTQNSLKVHLRTHTGVNPYKCDVCNRHFRERGSLQRHMRLHTGEKPYKCPICNRAFAEQGTLSRHLKAKMPCSTHRATDSTDPNEASSSTMLAQFSTMVADTQQYIIPPVDGGQQYILPAVQDQELGEDYVVLQTVGEDSQDIVESIEVVTDGKFPEAFKHDSEFKEQGQDTETLQIFDSSTGESLIIVADKSIVDLVRDQQLSVESGEGGSSLQKIKNILLAARHGELTSTTATAGVEEFSAPLNSVELTSVELGPEKQSSQEEANVPTTSTSQEEASASSNPEESS